MKRNCIIASVALALALMSCKSHYEVTRVERSRILIDKTYDAEVDAQAQAFIAPYKHVVDSIMSPVMGEIACNMAAKKPESNLSNLLSDILIWAAKDYNEQPQFSVYNMGGMRAAFTKGKVTFGDVLDVAPFENKICFLTLTGEKVLELFQQIASVGGEGVSHGVELEINHGKLLSARLHGKEIDPKANYRIATIDYLSQGNDRMEAFKAKTDVNSPQTEENNTRYIICKYFQEMAKQGRVVDAKVEGRIVVK